MFLCKELSAKIENYFYQKQKYLPFNQLINYEDAMLRVRNIKYQRKIQLKIVQTNNIVYRI